jgi:hypothetical protein
MLMVPKIPGATDQSYTPTSNGSYYVVVTSSEGCSSQSDAIDVTLSAPAWTFLSNPLTTILRGIFFSR